MKTFFAKYHQSFAALNFVLVGLCLCLGLPQSANAVNTTLNYTNVADAWLTPVSWSPANNWNSGTVKTNATTADVRLNVGTVANRASAVTYDATMGTTILSNATVATRGLVIASGNNTTGAVTIASGTLVIIAGAGVTEHILVGSPFAQQPASGMLTLSGGNIICTNASATNGLMTVPFRGGSIAGGPNFAQGIFTINSGSTAIIDRVQFGNASSIADEAAQCTGIINLNAGGTLATRYIRAVDNDSSQMASIFNFNGGTLRVAGPSPVAGFSLIADVGTNLTVNVKSGGAIVDTAGIDTIINKTLQDAGGGGLTKNGNGTLTFAQTNAYTGATLVNGGGLSFPLPSKSSALSLASGTTNSITVRNISWTNTVVNMTNATLNFALGTVTAVPSATTAVINTATLNVSGANVINITSGAGISAGVVKLIDYTSSGNRSGGGSFVLGAVPPGLDVTLIDGPNDISLNVTFAVQSLTWSAGNNIWATNGMLNWDSGVNAYQEYANGFGDIVNFTDAGGSFYTVNLTNDVHPFSVIFNHTTAAITLSGIGQITGTNGITKTGVGATLLSSSNSFSGTVTVNDGILQVDNGGALGSTNGGTVVTGTGTVLIGDGFGAGTTVTGETITLNGAGFGGALGQLRGSIDPSSPNVWAGPIVLAASGSRIGTAINGNITVAGQITDNGNNYSMVYRPGDGGTVNVIASGHSYGTTATFCGSGAVVKLGVDNAFSTNQLQVGAGTVDLNGFSQTVGGLGDFTTSGVVLNNGSGPGTLTINTGTNGFVSTASIQNGSQPVSVVKEGSGRQSLNSTNPQTYTGNTTVNNGELRLSTTLGNTAVAVNSGATLSVNIAATVAGTITVNSGGTLSPGLPFIVGVLTNTSTVNLNSGSTTSFRINAATNLWDRLVANSLNYGGTLVVTNQSNTPLTVGQVFQLVIATTPSGNFANAASVTILPGSSTGTFNPATGQLTITAVPPVPTLNVVPSGGSLQFSWSQLNGVYHLQSQTNSLNSGLGTNWVNYSTGITNPVTVPINAANESVFFRLVAP
jgi:autotransporter-associated beta strand protein